MGKGDGVGGMMEHRPLPYYVRLRLAKSEDETPTLHEWRGTAYSLFEAMLQAMMVATGKTDPEQQSLKVEAIEPDVAAYLRMVLEGTAEETAPRALPEEEADEIRAQMRQKRAGLDSADVGGEQ